MMCNCRVVTSAGHYGVWLCGLCFKKYQDEGLFRDRDTVSSHVARTNLYNREPTGESEEVKHPHSPLLVNRSGLASTCLNSISEAKPPNNHILDDWDGAVR